jgi:hypothetical protein
MSKRKTKKKTAGRARPTKKAKGSAGAKPKAKGRPRANAKAKTGPKRVSKDFSKLSIKQIVARIREHLVQAGYDPVLTGRACAGVYLGKGVDAKAIDFVLKEYEVPELADTMKAIGFERSGLYAYESKRCPLDVIFAPPPLAVGDDLVKQIDEIRVRGGRIKLLSPTDCTRQRLAMYYRWGDEDGFEEAVRMAMEYEVDMDLIKRWSAWEWCTDRYVEFEAELSGRKESE